jgi:CO/xanthine dehydrogenase Mo-binding subunit
MFTDDRAVPGALHVVFLLSIHAHALISCVDTLEPAWKCRGSSVSTRQDTWSL